MEETRMITEEQAQKEFNRFYVKAEKIARDPDKIEKLLQKLEKKLKDLPVLKDALSYIPAMGSLLYSSAVKKEYKELPIATIFATITAIAYFVSPVDLIPDFIPGAGQIDDAAVAAIALKIIRKDIDEYLDWRKVSGLDIEV